MNNDLLLNLSRHQIMPHFSIKTGTELHEEVAEQFALMKDSDQVHLLPAPPDGVNALDYAISFLNKDARFTWNVQFPVTVGYFPLPLDHTYFLFATKSKS